MNNHILKTQCYAEDNRTAFSSEAKVTNYRRVHLNYCSVEANY